jgi:tripartite-type tricarboxylate transporter receptor subunit TctC
VAIQGVARAMRAALADPEARRRLDAAGADPVESDPVAFAAVIVRDRQVARRIVAATGLRVG